MSANRSSSHFAPTKVHDPGSRFQIDVFLASRVLGRECWHLFACFLQISVHRGHPASLNLRGYRRRENRAPSLSRTKRPLNWRVSSSLETIVCVKKKPEKHMKPASKLGWSSANFLATRLDDSDQILQVCREPMKFTRQETNASDHLPILAVRY